MPVNWRPAHLLGRLSCRMALATKLRDGLLAVAIESLGLVRFLFFFGSRKILTSAVMSQKSIVPIVMFGSRWSLEQ